MISENRKRLKRERKTKRRKKHNAAIRKEEHRLIKEVSPRHNFMGGFIAGATMLAMAALRKRGEKDGG